MKILFVRHGESSDDIDNQYGGWFDFPLTENGQKQIEAKVNEIKELGINFDLIISSPLIRARKTAEILAKGLGLLVKINEYVKERNTYGVLSGMNKEEAVQKYPEQVQKLKNDEYVDGSERIEDLDVRIKKAMELIKGSGKQAAMVVTHGNFLKELFPLMMGKKLTKKDDGGWVLVNYEGGMMVPEKGSGIAWE